MEFWKILYTHFIRDPKGITYVAFFPQIESHAKMRLPNYTFVKSLNEIILYDCHFGESDFVSRERKFHKNSSISLSRIVLCKHVDGIFQEKQDIYMIIISERI